MKVRVINNSRALCIIPHCTKEELCSSDTQYNVCYMNPSNVTACEIQQVKVASANEIITTSKINHYDSTVL